MSDVVWASVWLAISICGAISNRRLFRFCQNRYKTSKSKSFLGPLPFDSGTATIVSLVWMLFAINSAIILALYISPVGSGAIAELYSVYKQVFLWLACSLFIYRMLYNAYYVAYAPIFVANSTKCQLHVYILGRRIGLAKPGRRIPNNRVLPKYERYLIEAKTADGNVVFSRALNKQDLDDVDWRVTIT